MTCIREEDRQQWPSMTLVVVVVVVVVLTWCFVEQVEMKDKFNKILIRYRPQLVDEMDCTELLNLLISRNILTRRQAKSISVSLDIAHACTHAPGCLQLLEIYWNLKSILEILEIWWNFIVPPGHFRVIDRWSMIVKKDIVSSSLAVVQLLGIS